MRVQTMNINNNRLNKLPGRQRGLATILIALFIGLAVTATALSILHAINSTQDRQLGSHAQTHAQAAAWTGAEALRAHFSGLTSKAEIDAFVASYGTSPSKSVRITGVTEGDDTLGTDLSGGPNCADDFDCLTASVASSVENNITDAGGAEVYDSTAVTMILTAIDASAQSSSSLEVVYLVKPGGNTTPKRKSDFGGAPAFEKGLTLNGGLEFTGTIIKNLNVNGAFVATGSLAGDLGKVGITGDVAFSSTLVAEEIWSNGNIYLTGSAGTTVKATGYKGLGKGNVWYMADAASAIDIFAHGNIRTTNSTDIRNMYARGSVEITGDGTSLDVRSGNLDTRDKFFEVDPVILGDESLDDYLERQAAFNPGVTNAYQAQLDLGNFPLFADGFPSNGFYDPNSDEAVTEIQAINVVDLNFLKPWHNVTVTDEAGTTTNDVFVLDDKKNNPANTVTIKYGIHVDAQAFGKLTWDGTGITGNVISDIEVECIDQGGYASATVSAPKLINCGTKSSAGISAKEVKRQERFKMAPPPMVNVYAHKDTANYVFEPEEFDSRTKLKVTVQGVTIKPSMNGEGKPLDGEYYLGRGDSSQGTVQRLCAEVYWKGGLWTCCQPNGPAANCPTN